MTRDPRIEHMLKSDLDTSVVMPFFKKTEEFRHTLKINGPYLARNGVEAIVVMDDKEGKDDVMELVMQYPFINWKVIVNELPHDWRNPSKAINVGIRSAVKTNVLVMGPDSEMLTDIILQFCYYSLYYPRCFFTGRVAFVNNYDELGAQDIDALRFLPYGSIFARKTFFETIQGYDESLEKWGGDDDNVRVRLSLAGFKRMQINEAMLIHRDKSPAEKEKRVQRLQQLQPGELRRIFLPSSGAVNDNKWGTDFDNCIVSWQKKRLHCWPLLKYAEQFRKYSICKENALRETYKIICLLPVHNEAHIINDVLAHLDNYCDGIILLDDSSHDGTYEMACSQKLLIKVQKERMRFDDLENRNMLLNIASFFDCEWFYFMDADERFDERYADVYKLAQLPDIDSITFKLVHIWDADGQYRKDVPEAVLYKNRDGVLARWRMFRNKGRMQINNNKMLHFPSVPFKTNPFYSSILIKHYGNMHAADRQTKYFRYQEEDKDFKSENYRYLLDTTYVTGKVADIVL